MSQFLLCEKDCICVVMLWLDSTSLGDLRYQAWGHKHGESPVLAEDMSVSASVKVMVRCGIFHFCPDATRDVFEAVCGGSELSGVTALAQLLLLCTSKEHTRSCRQVSGETDWRAPSETQCRVESLPQVLRRRSSLSRGLSDG